MCNKGSLVEPCISNFFVFGVTLMYRNTIKSKLNGTNDMYNVELRPSPAHSVCVIWAFNYRMLVNKINWVLVQSTQLQFHYNSGDILMDSRRVAQNMWNYVKNSNSAKILLFSYSMCTLTL